MRQTGRVVRCLVRRFLAKGNGYHLGAGIVERGFLFLVHSRRNPNHASGSANADALERGEGVARSASSWTKFYNTVYAEVYQGETKD